MFRVAATASLEHVIGAQGQTRHGQDQTTLLMLQRPELIEREKLEHYQPGQTSQMQPKIHCLGSRIN